MMKTVKRGPLMLLVPAGDDAVQQDGRAAWGTARDCGEAERRQVADGSMMTPVSPSHQAESRCRSAVSPPACGPRR